MCITSGNAKLGKTKILALEMDNGKHLLSYKNTVENISGKPNCMLLAIPGTMTRADFIDTTKFNDFFKDMENSIPQEKSRLKKSISNDDDSLNFVEHFELGIYNIMLARKAGYILENIDELPDDKRPEISQKLIDFFDTYYKEWSIVLCCFNGNADAQPIMFTYEPMFKDYLYFPGMDSHGGVPDLDAIVDTDHILFTKGKYSVEYTQEVPEYMPDSITYFKYDNNMKNGDWFYEIKNGTMKRLRGM